MTDKAKLLELAEQFTITREEGEHPYRIDVTQGDETTDIYLVDRSSLPWIVKRLLRRGALRAIAAQQEEA